MAKKHQRPAPKYYMLHNITSDDVFIATASKTYDGAYRKTENLYIHLFEELVDGSSNYTIDLFEIELIDSD